MELFLWEKILISDMRKVLVIFIAFLLSMSLCFAEEYSEPITLKTEINGVSGYPGFGLGLFPASTSFQYLRSDIKLFEDAPFDSKLYFYITYGFSNVNDNGREWDTGRPSYLLTQYERKRINSDALYDKFTVGNAFRQHGAIELWFGQPFIENPVKESEYRQLFEFRFGINIRYTATTESLSLGAGGSPTFVDLDGKPKGIFAHASQERPIIAYPWLNGDRRVLSAYLFSTLYFYPYREIRAGIQDGVYGYLTVEYSPRWLLNNISPKGYVTSDYYRINAYLEEKLVLFDDRQSNGWNWLAIYFGHSNTVNHIEGKVVPYYKIPSNYLSTQISDRLWLHFMGPNFITSDCYSYLELALNNSISFGETVNSSEPFDAVSYSGSFSLTLHLRLFNFIRFTYDCSYTFAQGINSSYPRWNQGAIINFSVSI